MGAVHRVGDYASHLRILDTQGTVLREVRARLARMPHQITVSQQRVFVVSEE